MTITFRRLDFKKFHHIMGTKVALTVFINLILKKQFELCETHIPKLT